MQESSRDFRSRDRQDRRGHWGGAQRGMALAVSSRQANGSEVLGRVSGETVVPVREMMSLVSKEKACKCLIRLCGAFQLGPPVPEALSMASGGASL